MDNREEGNHIKNSSVLEMQKKNCGDDIHIAALSTGMY